MDFSFSSYIINKNNLIQNVNYIKSGLKNNVKLCPVVKADAYGLGIENVVPILNDFVNCYAVANLKEGILVRKNSSSGNIIVLGPTNFECLELYSKNKLIPMVGSICDTIKLSSRVKHPIMVEFSLNTGMNRFGFNKKEDVLFAKSIINGNLNLSLFGAFSHLATKENDVEFMFFQKKKFDDLISVLEDENLMFHLSNTNAAINHPEFMYDMVRVGFGLYGMTDEYQNLKPVVEIKSRIVSINEVSSGEFVGYDKTYCAKKKTKLGVVPIGYFDGFDRRLSNIGKVLINGKFASIVGRVCMDVFMVDITDVKSCEVGTEVIICGSDGEQSVGLKDWENLTGASKYDLLCHLNRSRMNVVIK